MRPGWDTKRTALEGDAVWSALRLADGSVLLGSDAGGAIWRDRRRWLDEEGRRASTARSRSSRWTQTGDGAVYAGAMPGNKLCEARRGRRQGERGRDAERHRDDLVARVGGQHGLRRHRPQRPELFAISGGSAKQVFDTEDKRITALAVGTDGAVWLGTSERALVFRFDPKTNTAIRN